MILNFTSKQIKISTIGSDDNVIVIVNQTTGEIRGTHVVTYKKVDSEEFIKLFTKNIALTFAIELNSLMNPRENTEGRTDITRSGA